MLRRVQISGLAIPSFFEGTVTITGLSAFAVMSAWVVWVLAKPLAGPILTPTVWLPRLIVAAAVSSCGLFRRLVAPPRWTPAVCHAVTESSGLQSYVAELERLQRFRRNGSNYFIYLLPGYALWMMGWWRYRIWPHSAGLFVFVAVTMAATYIWSLWYNRRQDERVEQEIRALKVLQ
jgi:hypothetical protein